MINKRLLVFALTAFLVVAGLVLIAYVSTPKEIKQNASVLSPTPVEGSGNNNAIKVTPIIPSTKTNNESSFEKNIDKPALNTSEAVAKQNAITNIKQNPDAVYDASEFKIMYIETFNMFQVEIQTTNVKKAEDDAVAWFTTQGLTKSAVCKIPVQFYLNFQIKQQLNQDIPPLFYGC